MLQNSKILICVNNENNRRFLFDTLKNFGVDITVFDNNIPFLIDKFAGIFLDLIICEPDSFQIIADIKINDNFRHTPVLAVLNSFDQIPVEVSDKIDEFILLPLTAREINLRVRNILRTKKYRDLIELDAIIWQKKNELKDGELLRLKEYNKYIIDSFPMSILIIDTDSRIKFVNNRFVELRKTQLEYVINKYVNEVFNAEFYNFLLKIEINKCLYSKEARTITDVTGVFYDIFDRIFDMTVVPLNLSSDEDLLMIVFDDVTNKKKNEMRNLLVQELLSYIQDVIDLDKILFIILTCVTAGVAIGFGRAFLLLFDGDTGALEGKLGVGPESQDDANKIWNDISNAPKQLGDYIKEYDKYVTTIKEKHSDLLKKLNFAHEEIDESLRLCFREKRALKFENNFDVDTFIGKLGKRLDVGEFVIAPLISDNKPIGIIVADNKYSYRRIEYDHLVMLTLYATHAAQSIAIANAHETLLNKGNELIITREQLFVSEKLAAVGKLAANIAHEIRNPLSTIGGFANRILKSLRDGNIHNVQLAAKIIADEVGRLEILLSNIMDFTRSGVINKSLNNIKDIIENSLLVLQDALHENNIIIEYIDDSQCIELFCDPQQLKQVLINICKNSIDAINQRKMGAGVIKFDLKICDNFCEIIIKDNGCGIAKENLANIFSLFYTTKEFGTGLGMTIVKNIIDAHKGTIEYSSVLHEGTTAIIKLPIE